MLQQRSLDERGMHITVPERKAGKDARNEKNRARPGGCAVQRHPSIKEQADSYTLVTPSGKVKTRRLQAKQEIGDMIALRP
jgi:hypothetical protein